jgi:hypothetical protein
MMQRELLGSLMEALMVSTEIASGSIYDHERHILIFISRISLSWLQKSAKGSESEIQKTELKRSRQKRPKVRARSKLSTGAEPHFKITND